MPIAGKRYAVGKPDAPPIEILSVGDDGRVEYRMADGRVRAGVIPAGTVLYEI